MLMKAIKSNGYLIYRIKLPKSPRNATLLKIAEQTEKAANAAKGNAILLSFRDRVFPVTFTNWTKTIKGIMKTVAHLRMR